MTIAPCIKLNSTLVELQPGDATLYRFIVSKFDSAFYVTKTNGETIHLRIEPGDVDQLRLNAPEVLEADYDEYRQAVCDSAWMNRVLFPYAVSQNVNPWTFVAALAACNAHERMY